MFDTRGDDVVAEDLAPPAERRLCSSRRQMRDAASVERRVLSHDPSGGMVNPGEGRVPNLVGGQ